MTEKRFTHQRTDDYNFSDILDDGKWVGICHVDCEDDFVNKFNELVEENEQLKQQFILLLKKLGKKNVQCSFCEHGEHYSELVNGYYEPRFICHKKGQEYTQRSFCEDWKIMVKE